MSEIKNKTAIVFRIRELEKTLAHVKELNLVVDSKDENHGAEIEIARLEGEIEGLYWTGNNDMPRAKIFTNVIEE
jgi:hypothetical protein